MPELFSQESRGSSDFSVEELFLSLELEDWDENIACVS